MTTFITREVKKFSKAEPPAKDVDKKFQGSILNKSRENHVSD